MNSLLVGYTEESRFPYPPRETKIGSRNREFEKSKVALNDAKLLRYCLSEAIMHVFAVPDRR